MKTGNRLPSVGRLYIVESMEGIMRLIEESTEEFFRNGPK
jgi:hypothetical protein